MSRHGLEFEEINIEDERGAVRFVMTANGGRQKVPTFEVGGRVFHCSPYDPVRLGRELGINQDASKASHPLG